MTYREGPSPVPGVVLWRRRRAEPGAARILPDGCMDLIWDGTRLFVAGPDTRARWHTSDANASYVGLRFSRGLGPAFLGASADDLCDSTPDLDAIWASAPARVLGDQVAEDPEAALLRWLTRRALEREPPPLGGAVFELAALGAPVAAMAEQLGYGARQLHRRCLPLFGYGPQHLRRVLRLLRALAAARAGLPLAHVAAASGFSDQAHLTRDVRDLAGTTPSGLLGELAG